jgi:hypothetical protein
METQIDRVVEAARQLSSDELKAALKRILAMLEELEAQERQESKVEKEQFEIASRDEVMKLFYEEIEPQHEKLFEQLAKL